MAEDLDYVAMPDNVVSKVEQTWATAFAMVDGGPLWTGSKP
jgi:hypothetical protein